MISKEKWDALRRAMAKFEINEDDLVEKYVLGSGSGGQKINKTSSCVYLKHEPTGIEIKCQKGRSREANRFYARRMLIDRIDQIRHQEKSKRMQEINKIRKQKKRRSRKIQAKILEEKKQDRKSTR